MTIELSNPDTLAAPIGQFSQIAWSDSSEYLHVSGQVAFDRDGRLVGPDDFEAQMRQTYANIHAALEAGGMGFGNVVKLTTYLTRKQDLEDYRRVRSELYEEYYPDGRYPPSTLVLVAALVSDAFLIEIDAVAAG